MKTPQEIQSWSFVVSKFALDGGAMFGVIPRPMWERVSPPDSKNRISMVTRSLVLRCEATNRVVVIDSGFGLEWKPADVQRYSIDLEVPSLVLSLQNIGISPGQVTDAVISHLHFDHAGGFTQRTASGEFNPTFPNAIHHVQKQQWDTAFNPSLRDRGSFMQQHFKPLEEAGLVKFTVSQNDLPLGMEVMSLNGHTPGLQVPIIAGGQETLVFPSDTIPTAAHINLPWIMAYDLSPLATLKEKIHLLELAVKNNWTLVLQHDPEIEAVKISQKGDRFEAKPCPFPKTI